MPEQDGGMDAEVDRARGALERVSGEQGTRDAVHEAREFFRCSFQQAPIGMTMVGLDGRFMRVNDAFCALVGYSHEQLTDQPEDRINYRGDVAADADARRVLVAGDVTADRREQRYVHASGHLIWVTVTLTLIRDGNGLALYFLSQVQDVSERRGYERQLAHIADHDLLTGLRNRLSLERELASHAARVSRYGATGAVLMLDLDHFKYFNDTQGHKAGDELIVRVGQALCSRLRDSDVVARLGGDEFAVLLPDGDEGETQRVGEALVEIVRDQALPTLSEPLPELLGAGRRVTVSIGIARFADGERMTVEEIMVNADLAMYEVKDGGGDGWARYKSERHGRQKPEQQIKRAKEIEYAISHDGFELLAQPIVSLSDHRPTQQPDLRGLRDRGRRQRQPRWRVHQPSTTARMPVRDRRLRRWPRLLLLPKASPLRLPEDRPRVHHALRPQRDRPQTHLCHCMHRARHGHTHHRRMGPDDGTIRILTALGVDYAQGFHLGRPATLTTHLAASDAPRTETSRHQLQSAP